MAKSFFLQIEILIDRPDFIQECRTDRSSCHEEKCIMNLLTHRAEFLDVGSAHSAVVAPHNPECGAVDEMEFISKPGRDAQKIDSQFHGIMSEFLRVIDGLTVQEESERLAIIITAAKSH
jgi:hypothetical protein